MTSELAVDVLEAARRLSLGRTRFLELLRDGSIPSCLIGGRRVVRTADLEAYVASLPVSPVGAASGTSAEVTGQETSDATISPASLCEASEAMTGQPSACVSQESGPRS
jgi:excisionase family DNA binding protein